MSAAGKKQAPKKKQVEVMLPIEDNRLRKAAQRQRLPILVKKAMELSILCKLRVRLTIYNELQNELVHYESAPDAVPPHCPPPTRPLSNALYDSLFAAADKDAAMGHVLDPYIQSLADDAAATAADDGDDDGAPIAPAKKRARTAAPRAVPAASSLGAATAATAATAAPLLESPRLRSGAGPAPPPLFSSTTTATTTATAATTAAGRNRKKLSVVIPDVPALPSMPAQHLEPGAPLSALPMLSAAQQVPQLSALMLPPSSATKLPRTTLSNAPPFDLHLSPLDSPLFFDRPSPMTRSALSQLLSASGNPLAGGASLASAARSGLNPALFLPTPNYRSSSTAGPFADAARTSSALQQQQQHDQLPELHSPKR